MDYKPKVNEVNTHEKRGRLLSLETLLHKKIHETVHTVICRSTSVRRPRAPTVPTSTGLSGSQPWSACLRSLPAYDARRVAVLSLSSPLTLPFVCPLLLVCSSPFLLFFFSRSVSLTPKKTHFIQETSSNIENVLAVNACFGNVSILIFLSFRWYLK